MWTLEFVDSKTGEILTNIIGQWIETTMWKITWNRVSSTHLLYPPTWHTSRIIYVDWL